LVSSARNPNVKDGIEHTVSSKCLYSGGIWFEYQLGTNYPDRWLSGVLLSPSKQIPRQYLKQAYPFPPTTLLTQNHSTGTLPHL